MKTSVFKSILDTFLTNAYTILNCSLHYHVWKNKVAFLKLLPTHKIPISYKQFDVTYYHGNLTVDELLHTKTEKLCSVTFIQCF